jgi:hypothetical protein
VSQQNLKKKTETITSMIRNKDKILDWTQFSTEYKIISQFFPEINYCPIPVMVNPNRLEGQNRDFFCRFCRFFLWNRHISEALEKGHTSELKGPQVAHGWPIPVVFKLFGSRHTEETKNFWRHIQICQKMKLILKIFLNNLLLVGVSALLVNLFNFLRRISFCVVQKLTPPE